ncbi:hypothetical protein Tco_1396812, partial [Tanacetum coccineum]
MQPSFPELDSELFVPSFNPSDDPIASLNKRMAFLSTSFASRFPQTNNQLRTSSNPRNQATIQDERVIVQTVQGRQTQGYANNGARNTATNPGVTRQGAPIMRIQSFQLKHLKKSQHQQRFKLMIWMLLILIVMKFPRIRQFSWQISLPMTQTFFQSQVAKCNKVQQENSEKNETLTAELERYKEQVKIFEQRQKFDLNDILQLPCWCVIMEYLVKISKKARILELKRRHLKITVLTTNTPYPSRKIRRICACTSQKTTKETRSIR